MKESDWKVFKKIKEEAIEKYCSISLCVFRKIIDDEEESPHERYLLNYKAVESSDKKMSLLFDGQSRSKAMLQLLAMRREGLVEEKYLSKLSEEIREQTDPKIHDW
jgi:hypothetical protein